MNTATRVGVIMGAVILSSFAFIYTTWTIPPSSKVNFTIDGVMGIDVDGTLDFTSSEILFDINEINKAKMNVVLNVASINTGNNKRDKHLKTEDFFDSVKYPLITFRSSSIKKITDKSYSVLGDLKIKDVSKPVTIPFTFSQTGDNAVFKGDFTIDRMNYHVGEKQKLGVGDEVKISLTIPVTRK